MSEELPLPQLEILEVPSKTSVTILDEKSAVIVEESKQKIVLSCKRGPQGRKGDLWIPNDKDIPFDNNDNNYTAENVHDAIIESRSKAGWITYTSFVGDPKKAPVVFDIPFLDANYGIVVSSGKDSRSFSIESQTKNGFVINTNANQAITDRVFWNATSRWG